MPGFNALGPLVVVLLVLIGIAAHVNAASGKRGKAGYSFTGC